MISPEWTILPNSRIIGISDHHFGMTQPDNAVECQAIADLLEQASKAALDKDRGKRPEPPSQPRATSPSMSTTQTQYDLEYWFIRGETFKSESPRVGDIVRLVAESRLGPVNIDRETTAKLGEISITDEVHTLGRVEVEANATMEIGADKSYRMIKRATQKELFPTSYDILRLWKAFAKQRFPWPDLKFATIRVAIWQAHEEALNAARLVGGQNAHPVVLPNSKWLTFLVLRDIYADVESPQHPNGATVVVETVSYTKKGHTRGGGGNKDALEGGAATQANGSEIIFAVKVARPRPVIPVISASLEGHEMVV